MAEINIIREQFPDFKEEQFALLEKLADLYIKWNDQINVISRKDMHNLVEKHLLHSLSIMKFINFKPGTEILDLGTGGGLPGLPLAIALPEVNFVLVDGTGKKIKVVNEIIQELELENVIGKAVRAEEMKEKFDFVLARGVTTLDKLINWTRRVIKKKPNNVMPNGLFAYKGGNITQELNLLNKGDYNEIFKISKKIKSELLEDKFLIYVQA